MANKTLVRISIEIEGDSDGSDGLQTSLKSVLATLAGSVSAEAPAAAVSAPALAAETTSEAPAEGGKRRRGRPRRTAAPPPPKKARVPRGQGVTATVKNLVGTGYFNDARSASEVINTLADDGLLSDSKQVYAALKYLSEKDMLVRESDGDNFRYRSTATGSDGGVSDNEGDGMMEEAQ